MKQIDISTPKHPNTFAIVDDEDFEWLNQYKWYAYKGGNTWYAARNSPVVNGKRTRIRMHRMILGLGAYDSRLCDHRNHNGLDNRRRNLRICTSLHNQYNKTPQKNCSSAFKGVHWHKTAKKWCAQIRINGRGTHLGLFGSESDATNAYNNKAKEYFGEFAFEIERTELSK